MSQLAIDGSAAEERWAGRTWSLTWVVGGVLLFASSFVMILLSDIGTGAYLLDKSWFLQVVNRVTSGDVLYRDIFFGVTPLSVYLTAPATQVFGNAFLAAEAVWTVWFVLLLLVAQHIARQLGWGQAETWLLSLALIVFMAPWLWSPYSLLATLWLLVCCSATLSWISRQQYPGIEARAEGDRWLAIAGAAAGLCFMSKQNLGLYALAALGVAAVTVSGGWANRQQWPRTLALIGGPFLMAAIAVLLPVLISGGGARFLEYGFTNKGTFLRAAGYDYTAGLSEIVRLHGEPLTLATLEPLYWQLLYLLPPLALAALLIACLRSAPGERRRTVAMLLFTFAATLGIYPRATLAHLAFAVPFLLLGFGYAAQRLAPGVLKTLPTVLRAGFAFWLLVGATLMVVRPLGDLASGNYELSQLPHFRGFPVTNSSVAYFRTAEKLSALAEEDRAMMMLSIRAGFLYLTSGIANPTPFDYPLLTAFGHHGESEVIAAIKDGQIQDVCLDYGFASTNDPRRLQPKELLVFVEQNMVPRRELRMCAIYRYPS